MSNSTTIFNATDHAVAVVNLQLTGDGPTTKILPILEVSELSESLRAQVDCALDGSAHMLTFGHGISTVSVSLLDNLPDCVDNPQYESVVAKYKNILRKNPRIELTIFPEASTKSLTITGVVIAFTVSLTIREGVTVVLVSLKIAGKIK